MSCPVRVRRNTIGVLASLRAPWPPYAGCADVGARTTALRVTIARRVSMRP
jgi:hypothetical protein